MNRLVYKATACILLLSMLATVLPLDLLHHHEEATVCDAENEALESDPCHLSIYHANQVQDHQCNHESHLHENPLKCSFCQFFHSSRQLKSTVGSAYTLHYAPTIDKAVATVNVLAFDPHSLTAISGRAPPVG